MSGTTQTKKDFTWLHFVIILALMFGFGAIPPFGEITTVGMKMLGIFWDYYTVGVLAECFGPVCWVGLLLV